MKTRTNLELLQILLKEGKRSFINKQCKGLCGLSMILSYNDNMSTTEYNKLIRYIDHHRPEPNSKHYNDKMASSPYYWPMYQWAPRKAWMEDQVESLKPIKL